MTPALKLVSEETASADPRYTLLSGHPASAHQAAIFDAAADPASGSRIIKAVAGAGKTTVLTNMLRFLSAGAHVQGFAFNTDAGANLKAGLDSVTAALGRDHCVNFRMGTFHSVCFGALCRYLNKRAGEVKPDSGKCRRLLKARITEGEYELYGAFATKLVGYAKGEGVGCLCPDTEERWWALVEHHGLYLESEEATPERGIEIARKLLAYSSRVAKTGDIDYDDMLYLVVLWKLRLWQNDVVLVDELQDTNPVRRAIARLALKPGGRLFGVGDSCQPSGTMIEVATRRGKFNIADKRLVPIENLQIEDTVASWNGCSGHRDETSQKEGARYETVEGISQRYYEGNLIKVEVEGQISRYTPNHICVSRYRRKAWCVYIMRRNTGYRVGVARMFDSHGNAAGPFGRLQSENADAVWALDIFDTRREALLAETMITVRYGIPQTMFMSKSELPSFQDHELEKIWDGINNERQANEVILAYGRVPEYPFRSSNDRIPRPGNKGAYTTLRRPQEIRACNLLPGHEVLVRRNDGKVRWVQIEYLRREYYEGNVYSLSIGRTKTYFADGILTHNCQSIYGFTGASIDAMDQVARAFNASELPLTVSYRCARAVVRDAQQWVDYIQPADEAPEGEVRYGVKVQDALACLTADDAILCRQTAPLVDLAYRLIAAGRGCRILGKEIGEGLIALVRAQRARGISRLVEKLEVWATRESARFVAKGDEARAEAVQDRVTCVLTVVAALPETDRTIPALERRIAEVFRLNQKDDPGSVGLLTLATVHKAKGQEWNTVAILRPDLMPSRAARQEWQIQSELNCCYVAATRAKLRLLYIAPE